MGMAGLLLGGVACSSPAPERGEAVGSTTAALSDITVRTYGFESLLDWSAIWSNPTLALSSTRIEGERSLAVSGGGWSSFISRRFVKEEAAPSVVGFDLRIPVNQPNPYWFGTVQLYVDAPSVGLYNRPLGLRELNPWTPGQWKRAEFNLPTSVRTALDQNYTDLKWRIQLNVPPASLEPYLFDRFTFGPLSPCTPVNDGNPCTLDQCSANGQPVHTPVAVGTVCETDGNLCNGVSACDASGACAAGTPLSCDDGNACNGAEGCVPATGCTAGTAPVLDDGNVCTNDTCVPALGVEHVPVAAGTPCLDGNVCNGAEACDGAGACEPGSTLPIDDGNPCTSDGCDPVLGVTHVPVPTGTSCADANACNGVETCDGLGRCNLGTPVTCLPPDACHEARACNPTTGACESSPKPDGAPCPDQTVCNGTESCQSGTCVPGTPLDPDDGNPCTADNCDAVLGISHAPLDAGTPCSDGDPCNGDETCDGSLACAAGQAPPLDDGNPCTADACDATTGVTHTPVAEGTPCALDACVAGATCDATGACGGGSPVVVDDGDPCTVDTCDPVTGPRHSECTFDATVVSRVKDTMGFLISGENPVQQDVDPDDISVERAAVLVGRVVDADGNPVSGVEVAVESRPELGLTTTQVDGDFEMLVNGGGRMRVVFRGFPYLEVERQLDVAWGSWTLVPDVVLLAPDDAVTEIDLDDTTESFQVHRSSVVVDEDGVRQGTLLFPAGTQATLRHSDGTLEPLTRLNVRVTEFTVGERGPLAMPADLPASSAYTYAFEVNADEAVNAGAPSVEFSVPLVYYVDNFLEFPAGTTVPVGSFNREIGAWQPERSGIVLAIVNRNGGVAGIDANGDGAADSDAALTALGITLEERVELAELYAEGKSLWRVSIPHFTQPWDCNWGGSPPSNASPPPPGPGPAGAPSGGGGEGDEDEAGDDGPDAPPEPEETCEREQASTLECETQILRETIAVGGTPFTLHYASDRSPGRLDYHTARVSLSGPSVPPSLRRIDFEAVIAGRVFKQSFPAAPNQYFDFTWDGLDRYGRPLVGVQHMESRVRYVYGIVYGATSRFGGVPGAPLAGDRARGEIFLDAKREHYLGVWDARTAGFGGWTLDIHHHYDPVSRVLQRGDGQREVTQAQRAIVESWPKRPRTPGTPLGDGGSADVARFRRPHVIAAGPDGSLYVTDGSSTINNANNVRRIAPDNVITRFAGPGYAVAPGFSGDGGPALAANFNGIKDIEIALDGSMVIADSLNHRIRRIDRNGIVTTVVGTGAPGDTGDDGPALAAQLNGPSGVGFGRDGSLYIADNGNERVRKVTPDGVITTIGGVPNFNAATKARNNIRARTQFDVIIPVDVAEHPDGSVYATDAHSHTIRRYGLDGFVNSVAGIICMQLCPDGPLDEGVVATQANIGNPESLHIAPDGTVFFGERFRNRVMAVTPAGILLRLAGATGPTGNDLGDGAIANALALVNGPRTALGPNGLYFTDHEDGFVYHRKSALPALSEAEFSVSSGAHGEIYAFDAAGRHVSTVDQKTRAVRHEFEYGPTGTLSAVTDGFGNRTRIERDSTGAPTRIVAPHGQATELVVDGTGYLHEAVDPLGHAVEARYDAKGLLVGFTDRRGGIASMSYNFWGRLETDQDATGSVIALRASGNPLDWTVERESAEGHVTSYRRIEHPDGSSERINTFPDGTEVVSQTFVNGSEITQMSDGTVFEDTSVPDPRLGLQSAIVTRRTVLPSGLTRMEERQRTATLGNPLDPTSLLLESTVRSVNGALWRTDYDATLRRTELRSPVGRITRTFRDPSGRLVRSERTGILPKTYFYDGNGRLESVVQGTRVTTTAYEPSGPSAGYVARVSDALGDPQVFTSDALGRILSDTVASSSTSLAWDENGNLSTVVPPGQPSHSMSYTPVNLLNAYQPPAIGLPLVATTYDHDRDRAPLAEHRPGGETLARTYDGAGRVSTLSFPSGLVEYRYFPANETSGAGRTSDVLGPYGVDLAFTYDGFLLASASMSGEVVGTVSWLRNAALHPIRETVSGANGSSFAAFGYDTDELLTCASPTTCSPAGADALRLTRSPQHGKVTAITLGGTIETLAYNTFGELARKTASFGTSPLVDLTFDVAANPRDALGRIVQKTETIFGTTRLHRYEYDENRRLTRVFLDGTLAERFDYDSNGNRILGFSAVRGESAGVYDAQDRLVSYGSLQFTYAPNGELTSKTDSVTGVRCDFTYDALGNLLEVSTTEGFLVEYLVDGMRRRVGKRVGGALVRQWLYADELRPVAELDGLGNLVAQFIYASNSNTPDYVRRGSATYRLISDHLGSPLYAVNVNDASDVPFRATYTAFGEVGGAGLDWMPFGFAGGIYDPDTGLVRFGRRDYDPALGRWTSKEPLRFAGSTNFYTYAENDPVNLADRTGLEAGCGGASGLDGGHGTGSGAQCGGGAGEEPDHCGSEEWREVPDRPFGIDLTQACIRHDACYETCHEDNRRNCDETFRRQVFDECRAQDGNYIGCTVLSWIYGLGVSGGGGGEAYGNARGHCCQ